MMETETEYMRQLLPGHYTCEPRSNGVNCKSKTGIEDEEQWGYYVAAIQQRFGERFQEIDHQTCTNHVSFTVYIEQE